MATESAVTISGSQPRSRPGPDTCLVHNGSLSNHHLLRAFLEAHGERLPDRRTDSEVAAAFLSWRMREGDSLKQALHAALTRLDGFYHADHRHPRRFSPFCATPSPASPAVLAENRPMGRHGQRVPRHRAAAGRGDRPHLGTRARASSTAGAATRGGWRHDHDADQHRADRPVRDTSVREAKRDPSGRDRGGLYPDQPRRQARARLRAANIPSRSPSRATPAIYAGGMNKHADITIHGNAGTGAGREHHVRRGPRDGRRQPVGRGHGPRRACRDRGQCLGPLRHLDEGRRHRRRQATSATCRPSWRRRATLSVLGDAGPDLGDSIYEAQIFVRGSVSRLPSAPTASKRRCGLNTSPLFLAADGPRGAVCRPGRVPPLRLGPAALSFQDRPTPAPIEGHEMTDQSNPPGHPAHHACEIRHLRRLHPCRKIRRAAATGIYDIRGGGAKTAPAAFRRPAVPRRVDVALPARGLPRKMRDRGGDRRAPCGQAHRPENPIHHRRHVLRLPLSAQAKEALGRGANAAGTSTTTGDGGLTPEERGTLQTIFKHGLTSCLPSRYGMNPDDLRKADAIEVVVGQGAKPAGGRHAASARRSNEGASTRTILRTLPIRRDRPSARLPRSTPTGPGRMTWRLTKDAEAARDHRLAGAHLHQGRRLRPLITTWRLA